MKKTDRDTLHKGLFRQAFPATFEEVKQLNASELARLLTKG